MSDAIDVSDRTKFAMPVRNLISLIASVALGVVEDNWEGREVVRKILD